jgi:hypothetical protein
MATRKKQPESEFEAFTGVMDKLLSVPKAEIARREAAYRKAVEQNPRKRGPKRKKAVN